MGYGHKDESTESVNEEEAKFNFAVSTLMRLDKIFLRMIDLSIIRTGEAQAAKYDMCWELLTNACALIKDKNKEKAMIKLLDDIKLEVEQGRDMAGQSNGRIKQSYNWHINKQMDLFKIELSNILQEEGKYFVATKGDTAGL